MEAQEVRKRILDESARLFVIGGYDGIAMREIAQACGLSKAGLYYHFRDKEELFLAILKENLASLRVIIAEAGGLAGSSREKIAYFVQAVFARLPVEQQAIIRLANQEMGKVSPEARADFDLAYQKQFLRPLADLMEEGVRSGEFRSVESNMAVWGLLGLMYPFFNADTDWRGAASGRAPDFILSIFFDGVARHDG